MIARTTPIPRLTLTLVLFILLVAALVLSHPAARTVCSAFGLGLQTGSLNPADREALCRFYSERDSRLAWSGNAKAQADADAALAALSSSDEHGLDVSHFHIRQLQRPAANATSTEKATFDLLLTDAVLSYARELRFGRTMPGAVYRDANLPVQAFDAVSALEHALDDGTLVQFLEELAPPHPEYVHLKAMLARYRELAAQGDWQEIAALAKLNPKGRDPRLPLLRERLAREDATISYASADDEILAALKRYQARNGLEPDGVLGSRTLAMLNVQPTERVAQIEANMERWRWLPHAMETRYVMINAADATLQAVDNGTVTLRSRVIVGAPNKPTPMLRTFATEVTVNPPWNVPSSIARNEILPKLKRNPNYLAEQHMILVNGPPGDPHGTKVDWKRMTAAGFHYQIRQLPGADNALGSLKLEMPNAFNVYLHDTPGKLAFDRASRNLSHGCIRVQDILPLASVALTGDSTAAVEQLRNAIAAGETKRIALAERLAVYVLYWTAISNVDGSMGFRPDVYGRDKKLIAVLEPAPVRIAADFQGCVATG